MHRTAKRLPPLASSTISCPVWMRPRKRVWRTPCRAIPLPPSQCWTLPTRSIWAVASPKSFPLFATEIVGDGALSLPDQVIPNSIASAPLGGTELLFRVLGLQELKGSGVLPAGHHAARFLKGGHSSLLAPDENFDQAGAVTTEIRPSSPASL